MFLLSPFVIWISPLWIFFILFYFLIILFQNFLTVTYIFVVLFCLCLHHEFFLYLHLCIQQQMFENNYELFQNNQIGMNQTKLWCIRKIKTVSEQIFTLFLSLIVIAGVIPHKKEFRKYATTKSPTKVFFLEIDSDYYLCKESRVVLFKNTRQLWLMGCHINTACLELWIELLVRDEAVG